MVGWTNHNLKPLLDFAERDSLYQQLLSNYRELDAVYNAQKAHLSREDVEMIETYLAAGEAVYYRFAQIAYNCGKNSRFL